MRILGIDYGRKRLGLALSDKDGILASPLPSYSRHTSTQDIDFLKKLTSQQSVKRIVLGLPKNMDGSLGSMAKEVFTFAATLEEKVQIPTVTFDERLTSSEAERLLIQAGVSRYRRRTLRDSLAAVLILQGYLETLTPGAKALS
jgi:putative Holliday junction resolvase